MASGKNGTIYIGMTNNLIRRVAEHKAGVADGFTKKYNIKNLVYFEHTTDIESALNREKQMKKWKREWKLKLIEKENYSWNDLSLDL